MQSIFRQPILVIWSQAPWKFKLKYIYYNSHTRILSVNLLCKKYLDSPHQYLM